MQKLIKANSLVTLSLLAAVVFVLQGQAASSDWQDLGGGRARLVLNADPSTGVLTGLVEVRLDPGWSTYWRYPGGSGIPPVFDFSGSQNAYVTDIQYTVPELLQSGSARYAGYKNTAAFLFSGVVDDLSKGAVRLDLLIGLCEQVCIPAKARLEILPGQLAQSDPYAARRLLMASLEVPRKKPGEQLNTAVRLVDESTLEISLDQNAFGKQPELFVEGPADWYLLPARHIGSRGNGRVFHLDVSQAPKGTDILATKLRYTLVVGKTGIEFEH